MIREFPLHDTGFRIEVTPLNSGVAGLKLVYPENSFVFPPPEEWLSILKKALLELKDMTEIQLRIDKNRFQEVIQDLPSLGLKFKHERIEFFRPVIDLPFETGTPFLWQPMDSMERAAKVLHEVAQGDPDYDPNEDAMEALKYYFSDSRLTTTPDCLQFGYIERKLAALIVAQVRLTDGWSRITYMGLHPDFRGKGLGKWVHRRGFTMMKKLGGKNYFGGTVSTNRNMVKLFREHGCHETRVLQEWVWKK